LQEIQKNSNKNLVIFFMMITRYLQKNSRGSAASKMILGFTHLLRLLE